MFLNAFPLTKSTGLDTIAALFILQFSSTETRFSIAINYCFVIGYWNYIMILTGVSTPVFFLLLKGFI